MPATQAVMKLMTGRTTAATNPKKAFVTRIESAPVSGAVIRKDMQDERDAPFRRISATTGTTEQLHSGTGTPTAELTATDFRLSSLSHRRMASREMNTWMRPERNKPQQQHGREQQGRHPEKVKKTDQCLLYHAIASTALGDARGRPAGVSETGNGRRRSMRHTRYCAGRPVHGYKSPLPFRDRSDNN